MKVVFNSYKYNETIPVIDYLKKRKLAKYFNRETAAAIVSMKKLLNGSDIDPETPFYYATGIVQHEEYGLDKVVELCKDKNGKFSQKLFVEKAMFGVSPLTQFKVLYNMPLCFVAIEYNLKGDNAVIYSSATGLLVQALNAPCEAPILLGAGKIHKDGQVESGFALVSKKEISNSYFLLDSKEAIELFRCWFNKRGY